MTTGRDARRPPDLVLRHLAGRGASGRSTSSTEPPTTTGSRSSRRRGGRPRPPCRARPLRSCSRSRAAVPNADLAAPVVEVRTAVAPVPIPPGGAVLVAAGSAAARSGGEAPVGPAVTVPPRASSRTGPAWSRRSAGPSDRSRRRAGIPRKRGVHDRASSRPGRRAPVSGSSRTAGSSSSPSTAASPGTRRHDQLRARADARSARRGHRDGARRRRLDHDGVRRAPAEPAFGRPSGRSRRPCCSSTPVSSCQPAVSVVSPDGDGVADRQSLRYKLVRPSTVTVTLTARTAPSPTRRRGRRPGSYGLAFPPPPCPPPVTDPPFSPLREPTSGDASTGEPPRHRREVSRRADRPAKGRWKLAVSATDDVGPGL